MFGLLEDNMKVVKSVFSILPTSSTKFISTYNYLQSYVNVKPKFLFKQILASFINFVESFLPNPLQTNELHITVVYATNECKLQ